MNVAFRAGHLAGREFQDSCKPGSVEITRRTDLNPRITGLCDERRQPANLEFKPDDNEQLGLGELQKKARLGIDKVRVLIATSDGFDIHFVSANFLRQGRQVGRSRHDTNLAVRAAHEGIEQGKHEGHGRGDGDETSFCQ